MRFRCLVFIICLFTIVGCNLPAVSPASFDVTLHQVGETPSAMEDPLPSLTVTPWPASASCPIALGAPAVPMLSSPSQWATEVLSYINQGGSLTVLSESLAARGSQAKSSAGIADLNGDGYEDFIVALSGADPAASLGQVESALIIFMCEQEAYRLTYAISTLPEVESLQLHQILDVTGDGRPEILFMQQSCGAHTCFQDWQVLQWQSDQFVNVLTGRTDDLPSPEFELSDREVDGSLVLMVTGRGVLSAGAGPSRALTRVWRWTASEARFNMVEERLSPPIFRIHALHDADQAALDGDLAIALDGYQRVIEDPALDDYPFGDEGYTRLSAYALYRTMLLWIKFEDQDQAENTWVFLNAAHPEGSPGAGFRALADEFWQAYTAQPDLARSCQIAQAYAIAHSQQTIEALNYGYANKVYAPADICPYP